MTVKGAVLGIFHGAEPILVEAARGLSADTQGAVERAVATLSHRWKAASRDRYAVMAFADAYACDGEALADALRAVLPPHVPQFGATAGDGWTFTETRVFHDGRAEKDVAVLAFVPARELRLEALHGFKPVRESREMLITEADGKVVKALDRRPAVVVYREELMRLGLMREEDDLLTKMGTYKLGAKTIFGSELKIRTALQLQGSAIVLASRLDEGTIVRVVSASPDELVGAAKDLASRVLSKAQGRGAIIFDCSCRQMLLGERYAEQVRAFGGGRGVPYFGFASYGELAKTTGSLQGFHNTTAVMAAF